MINIRKYTTVFIDYNFPKKTDEQIHNITARRNDETKRVRRSQSIHKTNNELSPFSRCSSGTLYLPMTSSDKSLKYNILQEDFIFFNILIILSILREVHKDLLLYDVIPVCLM